MHQCRVQGDSAFPADTDTDFPDRHPRDNHKGTHRMTLPREFGIEDGMWSLLPAVALSERCSAIADWEQVGVGNEVGILVEESQAR